MPPGLPRDGADLTQARTTTPLSRGVDMARTRNAKPENFPDPGLCRVSGLHRWLFKGLECWADADGRLEDDPDRIRLEILPADQVDVDDMLQDLEEVAEKIVRYQVGRRRFIQILAFRREQAPHRDEKIKGFPPPPGLILAADGVWIPTDEETVQAGCCTGKTVQARASTEKPVQARAKRASLGSPPDPAPGPDPDPAPGSNPPPTPAQAGGSVAESPGPEENPGETPVPLGETPSGEPGGPAEPDVPPRRVRAKGLSPTQQRRFDRWYRGVGDPAYQGFPRKEAVGAAETVWRRLDPDDDLTEQMCRAVDAQRETDTWRRGIIPHPATWLNQRRWEDVPFEGPVRATGPPVTAAGGPSYKPSGTEWDALADRISKGDIEWTQTTPQG